MTYYAPTSISKVLQEIIPTDAAERRAQLRATWPTLASALSELLVANHLSVPSEWRVAS